MTTPIFTCRKCKSDVFSLANGADPASGKCGACLKQTHDGTRDGYLEKCTTRERYSPNKRHMRYISCGRKLPRKDPK